MNSQYAFADLNEHNELLQEINQLENKLADVLHQEVRLIAYSPKNEQSQPKSDSLNR